jgi:polyphosphate glucokinase
MDILGIDIGGSGIKGAPVDTKTGKLITERLRIPTPQPASPKAIAEMIKEIVDHFNWQGTIGFGFPAVVQNGIVKTASNIDNKWIGLPIEKLFSESTGLPCKVINDADAAGLAEIKFGAGINYNGIIMVVTLGTGIGSAIFNNGQLVPNTELGHVFLNDKVAEKYAAYSIRKSKNLSWEKWGKRVNKYLVHLEKLFWPEIIIIGGGASKKKDLFFNELKLEAKVIEAKLLNNAGIIGAALAAE